MSIHIENSGCKYQGDDSFVQCVKAFVLFKLSIESQWLYYLQAD